MEFECNLSLFSYLAAGAHLWMLARRKGGRRGVSFRRESIVWF